MPGGRLGGHTAPHSIPNRRHLAAQTPTLRADVCAVREHLRCVPPDRRCASQTQPHNTPRRQLRHPFPSTAHPVPAPHQGSKTPRRPKRAALASWRAQDRRVTNPAVRSPHPPPPSGAPGQGRGLLLGGLIGETEAGSLRDEGGVAGTKAAGSLTIVQVEENWRYIERPLWLKGKELGGGRGLWEVSQP